MLIAIGELLAELLETIVVVLMELVEELPAEVFGTVDVLTVVLSAE